MWKIVCQYKSVGAKDVEVKPCYSTNDYSELLKKVETLRKEFPNIPFTIKQSMDAYTPDDFESSAGC